MGFPVGEVEGLRLVEFLIRSRYRWYGGDFFYFLCQYFDFFLEVFFMWFDIYMIFAERKRALNKMSINVT